MVQLREESFEARGKDLNDAHEFSWGMCKGCSCLCIAAVFVALIGGLFTFW